MTYYRSFSEATAEFAGCSFAFEGIGAVSGLVTATDSKGKSTTGRWYATTGGVIYYGSAPTVTSLTFIFEKNAPKPFDRLSNTWNVNLATTSSSVLLDNVEPLAGERLELSR